MPDEKEREKKFAKDFLEKWARAEREEEPAEDALAREEEAVRSNPEDAAAWFRRGLVLADLERWADALTSLEKAEALQGDIPRIHLAKSYVLSRLGRPQDAAEEYREALRDLATGVDEDLAKKLAREEEVQEALAALAEDLREEPEVLEGLEELESLAQEVVAPAAGRAEAPPEAGAPAVPEEEFPAKLERWASEGYDVSPLREVQEREPDRIRTAFFQFEQNLRKIEVLRDTVNALDPAGLEEDIARIRQLFRAPYQIWRVEAEMAVLLGKADERDRARRARVTPSPRPLVVARPRVPGAVNGRPREPPGQVNGLINGVRSARVGLTNGLTNGMGLTNGLAGRRLIGQVRGSWKRILLVPLVAMMLLSVPLFVPAEGPPGIDWGAISGYVQESTTPNPDVDLRGYTVAVRDDHLSLRATVGGTMFRTSTGLDLFFAFVDADGDRSTGYDEGRIGADLLLEARGGNGTVISSHVWEWEGSNPDDWNGWQGSTAPLEATASGPALVLRVGLPGLPVWDGRNATLSLYMDDQAGSRSASALVVSTTYGALEVEQTPAAGIVTGVGGLLSLSFRAVGAEANVEGITVERGPDTGALSGFSPFTLAAGERRNVTLTVDATGLPAQTLLNASLVGVDADRPVTIVGTPARAYAIGAPTGKAVDGLFGEWNVTRADLGDVANPNVNILETAAEDQAGTTFLYVKVEGEALGGHRTPVTRIRPRPGPGGPSGAPPPPTARVGEDRLLAYFDAPAIPGGVPVGGVTADTLFEVRGRYGKVRAFTAYAWEGRWVARGVSEAIASGNEVEASFALPGVDLQGAEYVVESRDWRGFAERTAVEGVRGVRLGPDGVTFQGAYRADLPATAEGLVRFAGRSGLGLSWGLPSLSILGTDGIAPLAAPGAARVEVEGFSATYADAYPDLPIDVAYVADAADLKELILVRAPVDVPAGAYLRLDFPFARDADLMAYATGEVQGDALLVDGPIEFVDGRGLSLTLPAPWAGDATGKRIDLRYRLEHDRLAFELPGAWLADAAYPVAIDPTATYTLENDGPSNDPGENLGWSVAVGDFNGDGYADVLTGAPSNDIDGGSPPHGYAYIWYGPFSANDTTPDVRIKGTAANGRLGYAVAAGRFDGDQYWDALVATLSISTFSANVNLYYGSATWSGLEDTPDVAFVPPSTPGNFGYAVAAGDLDNANSDDVLIGEPGRDLDSNSSQDGVVYVYLSPFSASETSSDYRLVPTANDGGNLGRSIAVGKIDSDAYADVVVGEPFVSTNRGRFSFWDGSRFTSGSGDLSPDATINGTSSGDRFGWSISVGPVNGDAYADVAVGAYTRNTNTGAAYIFLANSNGTGLTSGATPDVSIAGETSGDQFGYSVLLFDFDSDGTAGLFVGAPLADAGGSDRGKAYWYDAPLSDTTVDETISGTQNLERLGWALGGGKFSSDTLAVVAIGAYLWDDGSDADSGRVLAATIPEPASALLGGMLIIGLVAFSVQRRRLVRKR